MQSRVTPNTTPMLTDILADCSAPSHICQKLPHIRQQLRLSPWCCSTQVLSPGEWSATTILAGPRRSSTGPRRSSPPPMTSQTNTMCCRQRRQRRDATRGESALPRRGARRGEARAGRGGPGRRKPTSLTQEDIAQMPLVSLGCHWCQ